jgi:mannonate dehydratase
MGTGPAVVRTESIKGRGDSEYSTFVLAKADPSKPLAPESNTPEQWWERVTWFQERIVPIAEEFKTRLGVHPQDPGRPLNFGGVNEGLSSFEGMKRYIEIKPSPYIGFNFCQGTMTENLEDPNNQIHDVIRYFGSRNKIFNVHFRNIRGKRYNFSEVFHDEGDIDMGKCIETYRSVGYDQMLIPDHTPRVVGKPNASAEGFAFAYGYIRGLLQQEAKKV